MNIRAVTDVPRRPIAVIQADATRSLEVKRAPAAGLEGGHP